MVLRIITGLEYLTSIGVVHRDISPGNVYLWDTVLNGKGPSNGMRGFVADLEFASLPPLPPHQTIEVQRDVTLVGSSPPLPRSPAFPGQPTIIVPPQPGSLPSPVHKKIKFTNEANPSVVTIAGPEMTVSIFGPRVGVRRLRNMTGNDPLPRP